MRTLFVLWLVPVSGFLGSATAWRPRRKSPSSSNALVPQKTPPPFLLQRGAGSIPCCATDTGVWTALVFVGAEVLGARDNWVGKAVRAVGRFAQGAVRFPGVALTLCFLSIPMSPVANEQGFWAQFWKSYLVYIFRSFHVSPAKPVAHLFEGAIGILALLKVKLYCFEDEW